MTTIKNVSGEKNKFKSLTGFLTVNKIDSYNRRGGERKKEKRMYRASQKIRTINVFLESLCQGPSLGVTVHLTSLGCPPTLC